MINYLTSNIDPEFLPQRARKWKTRYTGSALESDYDGHECQSLGFGDRKICTQNIKDIWKYTLGGYGRKLTSWLFRVQLRTPNPESPPARTRPRCPLLDQLRAQPLLQHFPTPSDSGFPILPESNSRGIHSIHLEPGLHPGGDADTPAFRSLAIVSTPDDSRNFRQSYRFR